MLSLDFALPDVAVWQHGAIAVVIGWILATGRWADTGTWDDTALWKDS